MTDLNKLPFVLIGDITSIDQHELFLIPGDSPLTGTSTINIQQQGVGTLNQTPVELYENIKTLETNQNIINDQLQIVIENTSTPTLPSNVAYIDEQTTITGEWDFSTNPKFKSPKIEQYITFTKNDNIIAEMGLGDYGVITLDAPLKVPDLKSNFLTLKSATQIMPMPNAETAILMVDGDASASVRVIYDDGTSVVLGAKNGLIGADSEQIKHDAETVSQALVNRPTFDEISTSPLLKSQVIANFQDATKQEPTGLGIDGMVTVKFGPAMSSNDNELSIDENGIITFDVDDNFNFYFTTHASRSGNGPEAILLVRLMYAADGIVENAVQISNTGIMGLIDKKVHGKQNYHLDLDVVAGSKMWVEMARDEAGDDDGYIDTLQPSGTLASWNQTTSAVCIISKNLNVFNN